MLSGDTRHLLAHLVELCLPCVAGFTLQALDMNAPDGRLASCWGDAVATWPIEHFFVLLAGSTIALYAVVGGSLTACDYFEWPVFMQSLKTSNMSKRDWSRLPTLFFLLLINLAILPVASYVIGKRTGMIAAQLGPLVRPGLPSLSTFCLEVVGIQIVFEIMFYYSHRTLHCSPFYKTIHKRHHEWKAPIAIAAAYAHPLEHIVSNTLPAAVAASLLNTHYLSLLVYSWQGVLSTLWAHSGFEVPTSSSAHDRSTGHVPSTSPPLRTQPKLAPITSPTSSRRLPY